MATVKIGNRTTAFQPDQANTTYLLAEGRLVESGTSGIYQPAAIDGMSLDVMGRIKSIEAGIRIGDDLSPAPDLDIHIGETGRIDSQSRAIQIYGSGQRVTNEGRLFGIEGIRSIGDDAAIVNEGLIDATSAGIVTAGTHRIVNSGTIAAGQFAIALNASAEGGGSVKNTGLLEGQTAALQGSTSDDRVINSGTIKGDVLLGAGNDTFVFKGGEVLGEVSGGAGADVFILRAGGLQFEEAFGSGFDTVKASISFTLPANVEELHLIGKAGIDGTGNDLNNYIEGNRAANRLSGAGGSDAFFGGAGNDVLTGGAGTDGFYFRASADREIVTDFVNGEDLLILFPGKQITDVADLIANHAHQKGDDLVISGDGTEMILRNFDKADLDMTDFTV